MHSGRASEGREEFKDHEVNHQIITIEHAFAKGSEYYERLDDSPAYVAGIVLDPRMKWHFIKVQWSTITFNIGDKISER